MARAGESTLLDLLAAEGHEQAFPARARKKSGAVWHSEPMVATIAPLRSRKGWWSVRISGGVRVTVHLHERDVVRLGLRVGKVWTEDLAEQAGRAGVVGRAREIAERFIGRRLVSRERVRERLVGGGVAPDVVEEVLSELARSGAIDDRALAEVIVESERSRGPAGSALVRDKLRAGRVDAEASRRAMARSKEPAKSELDAFLRQRLARLPEGLDTPTRARRLLGVLARRGIAEDAAQASVERVLRVRLGESGVEE